MLIDLLFNYNVFVSLFSLSDLSSFKENIFNEHTWLVATEYSLCDVEKNT